MITTTNTMQQAERIARLEKLVDSYEPENDYGLRQVIERKGKNMPEVRRYAAVVSRNEGRTHAITLHDSIDSALVEMRGDTGTWEPDVIVDLDTGNERTVVLALTVAEDNGNTEWDHDLDTESSVSRQHFIDTGRYLTFEESASDVLDTLSEDDYEKVTRTAEREHDVGATGLSEDDPRACLDLVSRLLDGDY